MSEVRLIDANALKKSAYPFPCAIGVEYAVPIRAVDAAPTIDPVRHAHWKKSYLSGYVPKDGKPICSGCDCWNGGRSNYCPNCGAKMDAPERGEGE